MRTAGTALYGLRFVTPRMRTLVGHGDRDADQLLDIAQERHLLAVAQRDRDAGGAGARGAADAVHIGLRYVRQVVVYHMTDAVDIDAARGDVGGDQRPHLALAKRRQHALALALRFVAVDRLGGDAGAHQALHHLVGAGFGPGEDQRAGDGVPGRQVDQDRRLGGAIDADDALLDTFDRGGVRHDRNLGRVA